LAFLYAWNPGDVKNSRSTVSWWRLLGCSRHSSRYVINPVGAALRGRPSIATRNQVERSEFIRLVETAQMLSLQRASRK
jgi:hypothetical protein